MQDNSSAFGPTAPIELTLPYEVRLRGLVLVLTAAFYVAISTASFVSAAYFWLHPRAHNDTLIAGSLSILGFVFLSPLYWVFRPSYTFYPDRIVKHRITSDQTLKRSAIRGLRLVEDSEGGNFLELAPMHASKAMRIHRSMLNDAVAARWFHGIRDLTQEAFDASEREVLADERYGSTLTGRTRRLRLARWGVQVFTWLTLALFIWGMLAPHPYRVVICLAAFAPILAWLLVVLSRDLIVWDNSDQKAKPAAAGGALFGTFLLALRTFYDVDTVDWPLLLAGAAIPALLLGALLSYKSEEAARPGIWALLIYSLIPFFYLYGAGGQLNEWLDNSPRTSLSRYCPWFGKFGQAL